jgi:hypothetical protein
MKSLMAMPLILTSMAMAMPASAYTISIDGDLSDWGIDKTTWLPADMGIHRTVEDQTGRGSYYLNPGWGGQAYDAEALYATISGDFLYIALATGHNPQTVHNPGGNSYGTGDFFIDFGKDGTYEVGINVNHKTPNGFESLLAQGGVYATPTYALGLFYENDPLYPVGGKRPTYLTGGSYLGLAELIYSTTPATGYGINPNDPHYFYEIGVDLGLLRRAGWDDKAFNIHWTMNCGNDSIFVDPPPGNVPEPGTLALLPLGLVGLGLLRRRASAQ